MNGLTWAHGPGTLLEEEVVGGIGLRVRFERGGVLDPFDYLSRWSGVVGLKDRWKTSWVFIPMF